MSLYDEFCRRMGFPAPPNFITTQGHAPETGRGTWEFVKHVLLGGETPRWQKELMIVAISRERNCRYCMAAHTACCTMLGVNAEYMVDDVSRIPDAVVRDKILFAMKAARDPQGLTSADFDRLRAHGLGHAQIVELIGVAGLAVYLNILADASGMQQDEMISGARQRDGTGRTTRA
jgi:uncharacterized peroxidase-related enzyme